MSDLLAKHRAEIHKIATAHNALDVRVFGSVVRDDDRSGSDLDLLVTFAPGADLFDQVGLAQEVEDLLGLRVDVVSAAALKSEHQRILDEAKPL